MDFSQGAGQSTGNGLLPKGLVVWANFSLRAIKQSKAGGQYLDVELTIAEGQPYASRKVWDMIGDPGFPGNSEDYRQMGMVAIARILEAGRGAGPQNMAAYQLQDYQQLNGLKVAIKIGIEKGRDGYEDKNRVAEFLTPNPQSQSGHKGFQALIAGRHTEFVQAATPAPAASGFAATTGFGGTSGPAPAPANTSTWGQPAQQGGQPGGTAGFTTSGTMTSPSDPNAAPNWLAQANG